MSEIDNIITAEIHRKGLENVTNEMAISLVHTSGSPTVVDAKDFSTCILDMEPEHLGFSAYVLLHFGTSVLGTELVQKITQDHKVEPGDGWIVNDPYDGGAAHQGDLAVVMPMFYQEKQVGWGFVNMHLRDIGGSGLGGIAPGAVEVFAEGLRFPAIKAIRNGELDPEWERFFHANVRAPGAVLNDIRSMIAANKVGNVKLNELIGKFGVSHHHRMCEINKNISEKIFRDRVNLIPDGTYSAREWCEFDGISGANGLMDISVEFVVSGSNLKFKFAGSPQVSGYINAGKGAIWGQVATAILTTLAYGDVRVNGGFWRPIEIDLGEPGTIVNARSPAPVSNGHVVVGMRACKLVYDVLAQALGRSSDPTIRARIGARPNDGPIVAGLVGKSDRSDANFIFYLDNAVGIGGGAQAVGDGQDAHGCACMTGCGLTDLEVHEAEDPLLFLSRSIALNSGGPGCFRGGHGLTQTFVLQDGAELHGQLSNPCALIPATGIGGGYPGGAGRIDIFSGSEASQLLQRGVFPDLLQMELSRRAVRHHDDEVTMRDGDVVAITGGGGGGVGDPLLRKPELVAVDVRNSHITLPHAKEAYGVVLDEQMEVDQKATDEARATLLIKRLGNNVPARKLKLPDAPSFPVAAKNGRWLCGSCGYDLGSEDADWHGNAAQSSIGLAERFAKLDMSVPVRHNDARARIIESACPSCALLLSVDLDVPTATEKV